ncbi:tetratricopeptide repeat protein [Roseovarius arcticus]|uniref:tetratricopeptide repeat protein n=1 Tax=Roseovarius arcticus TaxID=2547404 RepID=UPI0011100EF8|nr:tetratricopeptide repeat protein [Roseovarius arcticus]
MTMQDITGHTLTGAGETALPYYETAIAELQCYRADPVASIDAALAESPDFAMAHALKAWLHLLGTEPGGISIARAEHEAAAGTAATDRERGHVAALGHLVEGRWHAAGRVLEDVTITHPRDALGLLAGHQIDFFTGHSRMLRDRIARALPAWDKSMPGYHSILGMHAFGLEETGDYARAEAAGRQGVELQPRDGWSQHAVAHVMEMQCRQSDGIAWMRGNADGWSGDSFFQVHNWWHLALYHLEMGDTPAVLALFDNEIYGAKSGVVMDMVDATALLWRLTLHGVDVGDRWESLADSWATVRSGFYAFNDAHAVMAFIGAGRRDAALALIATQAEAMARPNDNAGFTSDVGHAVARAILAFGDGDFEATVRLLRQVRSISNRFGGSHAQRDVIELTLIEASLRAGNENLARALTAERADRRHDSPLSQLFLRRADALATAT